MQTQAFPPGNLSYRVLRVEVLCVRLASIRRIERALRSALRRNRPESPFSMPCLAMWKKKRSRTWANSSNRSNNGVYALVYGRRDIALPTTRPERRSCSDESLSSPTLAFEREHGRSARAETVKIYASRSSLRFILGLLPAPSYVSSTYSVSARSGAKCKPVDRYVLTPTAHGARKSQDPYK